MATLVQIHFFPKIIPPSYTRFSKPKPKTMNLTRHQSASRALSRPLRGDAEPWQYVGYTIPSRAVFDPSPGVYRRHRSLKVNAAGWRVLLNVLRIR